MKSFTALRSIELKHKTIRNPRLAHRCAFSVCVSVHRSVLLSALVRAGPFCHGWKLLQRPTAGHHAAPSHGPGNILADGAKQMGELRERVEPYRCHLPSMAWPPHTRNMAAVTWMWHTHRIRPINVLSWWLEEITKPIFHEGL